MKVKCTHIDWDISNEDIIENFGCTIDKNGLPYTARDLDLPAYDATVEIEIDDDAWDESYDAGDEDELICDKLFDTYEWRVNSFRWEVVK